MGFWGVDIIVVEDGYRMKCPNGVDYVVSNGSAVNNGKGKIFCTQADFDSIKSHTSETKKPPA